jgi:hypothetical protein
MVQQCREATMSAAERRAATQKRYREKQVRLQEVWHVLSVVQSSARHSYLINMLLQAAQADALQATLAEKAAALVVSQTDAGSMADVCCRRTLGTAFGGFCLTLTHRWRLLRMRS